MKAAPPGPARSWVEMLEAPWDSNPHVVVVMAPVGSHMSTRASTDGEAEFKCLELETGHLLGVQVTKPKLDHYWEHEAVFDGMDARMVQPGFIGRLSEIPPAMLTTLDFLPLVFRSAAMSDPYLNLKHAVVKMGHLEGKQ